MTIIGFIRLLSAICWITVLILLTMVNKCLAYGCTSGYKSHTPNDSISYHSFPLNNKDILDKWMRADFIPTKYSRMCSLHFKSSDFVQHSTDLNSTRRRDKCAGKLGERLVRRFLKADAIPSVFPNAAKHLSVTCSPPRPTVYATSPRWQQQDAERCDIMEQSFRASEDGSRHVVCRHQPRPHCNSQFEW